MSVRVSAFTTLFAFAATSAMADEADSAQIIQMSRKAVGGAALIEQAPYTLTSVMDIKTTFDRKKEEPKTVTTNESYKNGKLHKSSTVLIPRIGKPFAVTTIADTKKPETWESVSSEGGRWKKVDWNDKPTFPVFTLKTDEMTFDPRPKLETINGVECYKLTAKHKSDQLKNWTRIYYIRKDNNLLHQVVNVESTNGAISKQYTRTYTNYRNVSGASFPMTITDFYDEGKAGNTKTEIEISNFTFSKNIPDSLFVVPTHKGEVIMMVSLALFGNISLL
jgi:hypothetical protein